MANIVFDFLHNYETGERREPEPANAYQYDEGHVLEAILPSVVTTVELHYWIRGMEEAEAYTPASITPNTDGSCTILGNIPNKYFETNGELRIYIVVTDGDASITTYEGKLHICQRSMPDDYVDDDPENEATRVLVEAQAAATTATQQAQAASASAGQAQQSAQTLSQSVAQITTNTQDISTLKEDLSSKANIDGYYEDMTVGDAEQLVASQYVEDSVPYLFRTTGGSADVGNREYVDAVVGGTVVWNQLVDDITDANWRAENGVTLSISNGVATFSTTIINNGIYPIKNVPTKENHVYLIGCSVKANSEVGVRQTISNAIGFAANVTGNGAWQNIQKIIKATSNTDTRMYIVGTTADGGDINTKDIIFIDLTQMFGSTIADYIYSLEQATAGAGVAWFKNLFPNMDAEYSYHEDSFDEESPLITKKLRDYQPGILLSIEGLVSHDTDGFNQWDEEWEVGGYNLSGEKIAGTIKIRSKNKIKCVPNTTYYFACTGSYSTWVAIFFYDANGDFVSSAQPNVNRTFSTPDNAWYMTFNTSDAYGNTYHNDICINLSWSGTHNGEYQPYEKHIYPLDPTVVLRGIPKLDAENNLYYDGDRYLSDGTVERRYGIVDLGTLNWSFVSASDWNCFSAQISDKANGARNFMCAKYVHGTVYGTDTDKIIIGNASSAYIYIRDTAYTDAASFKASLSGVYMVYELATPTTETAEPYQQIQVCDDFGTEEYVSTSIVPVGHNTRYPANLRDKLQHLPDLADDDGYYMISQSNKQMHLELFRIPKAPTSPDGTYVLKATVSGGTPTYTWEAQV